MRRARSTLAALAAAALVAWPASGQARWLRAETDHFVVYSSGPEAKLREFAAKLATFDAILRTLHGAGPEDPGRKLEVYLIRRSEMQRVAPGISDFVFGFYEANPRAVFAVAARDEDFFGSDDILFHEYTHHFMLAHMPSAYPAWLVEGYAEYFGPTVIRSDTVELGRPNGARTYILRGEHWMRPSELLAARPGGNYNSDAFYAQSWLLVHYMMSDATRARQLDAAIRAIRGGTEPLAAIVQATGVSSDQLGSRLRDYARGRVLYREMPNRWPPNPPMTITSLPDTADDLLLEQVSLLRGVRPESREGVLKTIRGRAAKRSGDRLADLTLARAEIDYGDRVAGEAILARRLESDPKDVEALRLMGQSRLDAGEQEKDLAVRARLFAEARPFLGRAYQADPDDYRTLYAYAKARSLDRDFPNDNTLNVMLLAQQLAPSVEELRINAGGALLSRRRPAEAERVLAPLAYSPHAGPLRDKAAELLAKALTDQGKPATAAAPAVRE